MNRIWKDPVWSKVIATGIIGLIGFLYVVVESLTSELSFKESFINIMTSEISLYLVVLIIVGLLLFQILFSFLTGKIRILTKEEKNLNRKIKAIVGNDYKYRFNDIKVLARYSVGFDDDFKKPYVYDIQLFCNNHNPPLKLVSNQCYATNECAKMDYVINEERVRPQLESQILQAWDDLDTPNKTK
jgi:hypothetical protein